MGGNYKYFEFINTRSFIVEKELNPPEPKPEDPKKRNPNETRTPKDQKENKNIESCKVQIKKQEE